MWLVAWVFGWATRHIEQIMADVDGVWGRCGSCGWGEFELCDLDEPDLPGTVQIDGAGNVVGVTGLLYNLMYYSHFFLHKQNTIKINAEKQQRTVLEMEMMEYFTIN